MMGTRIMEHPILGEPKKGKLVHFTYDGQKLQGYEGEPIAAALKAAGIMIHRYTKKEHTPRGIFCAIGRCTDCVMVVDGVPNVRTCVTPLKEGMKIQTQYGVSAEPFENQKEEMRKMKRYDLIVVGAGPSGKGGTDRRSVLSVPYER